MQLTIRQNEYLKLIINDFITNGNPIGSHTLIKKYNLDISSATVRNEMNILEIQGYIIKVNTSSGRIPSTKGYQYYVKHLMDSNNDKHLEQKLNTIFAKRTIGINFTINEAIEQISEITGLTIITSKRKVDELLKLIQLIPMDDNKATIIIVTSSGRVESQNIIINKNIKINDLKVAVRLFQERLIDTPISELPEKTILLKKLLKDKVVNIELLLQEFVTRIFNIHFKNDSHIYGEKNIIKKNDLSREQLIKLISLLDKKSIWDSIENQSENEDNLKISIGADNTSIISKKIIFDNSPKEISIVGSNRLQYQQAILALKILEKFLLKK